MKKMYRVKKSRDIEAIIKNRHAIRTSHLKVFKKINPKCEHFRFAVSVSKKFGNAVERNKVKRQIRMIVSKLTLLQGWDILIIVNPEAKNVKYLDLEAQIKLLFSKLKLLEVKE